MKKICPVLCLLFLITVISFSSGESETMRSENVRERHYGPDPNRQIDESRVTYYVSPDGSDDNDGKSRRAAFSSMQKAADIVQPGETVLVTKGIYKHGFHIHKEGREGAWITFVAEPGVEIRGSDVRKDWQREPGDSIYSIPRPELLGYWQRPDRPLYNRLEQVFINGTLLRHVTDYAMLKPKGAFYVDDAEKKLYVCLRDGKNPNEELTEVSMRTWAIAVGGPPNMNFWREERIGLENKAAYIIIDGFQIRHIADFTRMSAIQVRGICHHIVIQNCDVQWGNYSGISASSLTIWSSDEGKWIDHQSHHVTIRNNRVSNCGAQAMGGGGTSYCVFEYNIMDNNNYKGVSVWSEGGAIKTGFCGKHIIIRGNVARNNHNHGLWIDYGSTDCIIENNFVYNSIAGKPARTHCATGQRKGSLHLFRWPSGRNKGRWKGNGGSGIKPICL